jgi:hypothetical protein
MWMSQVTIPKFKVQVFKFYILYILLLQGTNSTMFFAANWWESFGNHCPQLQKFAIRVLSQTCNASGCERNWSVFERIHTKKKNCLEQKQLNDLVFVQYNLRLRHNQLLNKRLDSDPIVLDDVDSTSDWVAKTHPPKFDVDDDLEAELAGQVQMDADPLLGPRGPIPVLDMAGPSGTAGRRSRCCIPHVPRHGHTRTTTASATSKRVVTNVPDGDESEAESESDDDVKVKDAHAISTSNSSDD